MIRNSGYACASWYVTKMEGFLRLFTVESYSLRVPRPLTRSLVGSARIALAEAVFAHDHTASEDVLVAVRVGLRVLRLG